MSKFAQMVGNDINYETCMLVTLNTRGTDGTYNNFDIQYLSLADLEKLHDFVDKLIREEDAVGN